MTSYIQQSFSAGDILTATEMNQIEDNIIYHSHGIGKEANEHFGDIYISSATLQASLNSNLIFAINSNADYGQSLNKTMIGINIEESATGSNYVFVGNEIKHISGNDNVIIGTNIKTNSGVGQGVLIGTNIGGNLNKFNTGAVYIGANNVSSGGGGIYNIGIGYFALQTIFSNYNIGIGHRAAFQTTSGGGNVALGKDSLYSNVTGYNNTALGYASLFTSVKSYYNCTGVGYYAEVTGSDQVQLGNSSTTTYVYGTVQNRSDRRDKADIKVSSLGLEFVKRLRPVDYKWNFREDYKKNDKPGSKKRKRYHHGLIAQDVKEVCDKLKIDFGGLQHHKKNGGKDVWSLGYDELIAPMINAIKELTDRVETLEKLLSERK